jgi:hypothetical protein
MAVVDRQAHQVQAERADEPHIVFGEEVLQEAVEKDLVPLVAEDITAGFTGWLSAFTIWLPLTVRAGDLIAVFIRSYPASR